MHELGYLCYLEHQLWGEALSIFRDQVRNTLKDSSLGFRGKKKCCLFVSNKKNGLLSVIAMLLLSETFASENLFSVK